MKTRLILLFSILLFSSLKLKAEHAINYDCHPYYDASGNFDLANFQEALVLNIEATVTETGKAEQSIWLVFLLGLGGGLIALLTPCVFPMIPLTVSYFTKGSGNKKQGIFQAILYGFFIFLIYTLVSAPFHLLNLAPDVLSEIATNVWLNIAFFVIFVVFAFSFFGYYEIQLPSGLANKVSSAESAGGVIGVFFMALTLVIVSFSCTGPLVGSLLAGTLTQGAWYLTAGMAGFGIALGLPFALFALFPGIMSSLPKSGGWLNTVKVILGYLELALALKFISNADLVDPSLVIIKREIFFAIWILIALLTGAYLFGWYQFKAGMKEVIGKGRIALGVFFILIAAVLVPSLFGKDIPLVRNVIAGFPPPMQYSIFNHSSVAENNVTDADLAKYNFSEECPHDLPCFHDFYEAQCYAQAVQKPLFIDFTGYACVNCRKMEENVWIDPEILSMLANDVVLVSLYVDDKTALPEEQAITIKNGGYEKKLRTEGNKWSYFQAINFTYVSQPLYVMLNPDANKILMPAVGYTPDIESYKAMIKEGIQKFKAN
ncbi:MAG: thioredoxin family protein [Chitinophagales bacterium]|nr:thioredoxin family protein [Chitinophagales bacterium]